MRFGSPLLEKYDSPQQWTELIQKRGHTAANSPVKADASDSEAIAYGNAAKSAGIVIAEQGCWHVNCLSENTAEKEAAIQKCIRQLEIAELLEARCCVSLAGSKAENWDAPHKDNMGKAAFAEVVENCRRIIDAVKPQKTFYTLEPMPWTMPYDAENELNLIKSIDRAAYAVHFDPVNMVYSPDRYFKSGEYITNFVDTLGSYIRVCHVKDVILSNEYVWRLHECLPGEGALDYDALFTALDKLDPDLPVTTEHLKTTAEYDKAEAFIRNKIKSLGLTLL